MRTLRVVWRWKGMVRGAHPTDLGTLSCDGLQGWVVRLGPKSSASDLGIAAGEEGFDLGTFVGERREAARRDLLLEWNAINLSQKSAQD